ncbi:unnamed protein product [Trichogramma brassicae]|uniref:Uncharacterized protein n=1 Tax=Trichogramma brassicae TaxID=86971 RepID=A0A6H5I144_9HYME|nr:unnamed protein product [Trichogramma brassicae]
MAPRDRRNSFDRINSNNRQEGAQSNNEAPSNDDQPRPVDPLPTSERGQEARPLRRIDQVISIITLRRNSNPEIPAAIPSPSARRFQPADEPERRFERAFNMPPRRYEATPESRKVQQEDQANITLDIQPPQPDSSESPQQTTSYTPSRDRRKSFDRIHSNNRQEGAQSDSEAPSYDLESLSSLATQGDSQYVHVGSSTGGSSIDGSDSGSTLTIRRGSNPENLLPTGGRFQPGDEPERREEPIDQHQQEDQVNITMDVPPTEPQSIEKDIDRGTKFILGMSLLSRCSTTTTVYISTKTSIETTTTTTANLLSKTLRSRVTGSIADDVERTDCRGKLTRCILVFIFSLLSFVEPVKMASRDRRNSFDRINSNNRQEGAQSNNEAPSNDDQPRPVDPLPTTERGQEASPSRRINQVISIFTLQRNSSRETPGRRRNSFDRINSNNRVEDDQSDDEVTSNDLESLSSYATTAETAVLSDEDNHRRHAGPSPAGSSIDESDSESTLTIRRGSNPENLLPTGGRFQPGDEPERREEAPQPIDRQPRPLKVRFDVQPRHRIQRSPSPPPHRWRPVITI